MMLAKAMRLSKHRQLHIYSTGVIYDCHLGSSNYVYNTGHSWLHKGSGSNDIKLCTHVIYEYS